MPEMDNNNNFFKTINNKKMAKNNDKKIIIIIIIIKYNGKLMKKWKQIIIVQKVFEAECQRQTSCSIETGFVYITCISSFYHHHY